MTDKENQIREDIISFLNDKQKTNKISNILSELKREKKIINVGSDTKPCWKSTK